MKRLKISIVLCLVLFVVACATSNQSLRTNAYKTLAASATVYEGAYPAFLELAQKGIVSADVKAKGRDLAVKYWAAYHAAASTLNSYETVQTSDGADKVTAAISAMQTALSDLTTYVQPFLAKGVK